MLGQADRNNSGKLGYEEFLSLMARLTNLPPLGVLKGLDLSCLQRKSSTTETAESEFFIQLS